VEEKLTSRTKVDGQITPGERKEPSTSRLSRLSIAWASSSLCLNGLRGDVAELSAGRFELDRVRERGALIRLRKSVGPKLPFQIASRE
jgi:hypothetical protein